MSDRCYLEKCRDRLYPEFVIGNVAVEQIGEKLEVRYRSGTDLLAKTLDFYRESAQHRLDHTFNRAYRYLEAYFQDGENPYMHFIEKNLSFLRTVIEAQRWQDLRRKPPCEVPDPDAQDKVVELADERLREVTNPRERTQRLASGAG